MDHPLTVTTVKVRRVPGRLTRSTIAIICMVIAVVATIGGDCLWAVAMGRHIASTGIVDASPFFATAPSNGWHNVPVLGELVLAAAHWGGLGGLVVFNAAMIGLTFLLLAYDGRRSGANDRAQAITFVVVTLAVLPDLLVVRLGVLSLPAFALLLVLLRGDRVPSRRIFWVPVLLAVWGNLHGAVLVGVALTGCYLLLERLGRAFWQTVMAGLLCLLAIFANPQGWHTLEYYRGVMGNVLRERGIGLWASIDLSDPMHLALIASSALLMLAAARAHRPRWEIVAVLVLALATWDSARYGVWLVFLLATPAAVGLTALRSTPSRPRPNRDRGKDIVDIAVALTAAAFVVSIASQRAAQLAPVPTSVVTAVIRHASGHPVLAGGRSQEALVLAGARVVVGNPIDAFSRSDQAAYVDYIQRGSSSLTGRAGVILVGPSDPPDASHVADDFRLAQVVGGWQIFVRSAPRGG